MGKREIHRFAGGMLAAMLLILIGASACADGIRGSAATKTSEIIDRARNAYRISIEAPGMDGEKKHDEIIIMLDSSYSEDNTAGGDLHWREEVVKPLKEIARPFLDGSKDVMLTLMSFGVADNVVASHISSMEEFEAAMDGAREDLLYGRSATNCEVGFTGAADYIDSHDIGELDDVFVIYASDGGVNLSDEPAVWSDHIRLSDFRDYVWPYEVERIMSGGEVSSVGATQRIFGEEKMKAYIAQVKEENAQQSGAAMTKILLDPANGYGGEDVWRQWMTAYWKDVYAQPQYNLTYGQAYPISLVEKAFVDYDTDHGCSLANALYMTIYRNPFKDSYAERAVRACENLASDDRVAGVYLVHLDKTERRAWWMNPENDGAVRHETTAYYVTDETSTLTSVLRQIAGAIVVTPYNDVVITDYTSKWVNFDPSSVKLFDGGTLLWADGQWQVGESRRPTKTTPPISWVRMEAGAAAQGGSQTAGNTSGEIYRLTWHVKDGALLATDVYRLEYDVTADTLEEGFVYGREYPANGDTYADYTDEDGEKKRYEIRVPTISAKMTVDLPQTGDASSLLPWALLLAASAAGVVIAMKRRR